MKRFLRLLGIGGVATIVIIIIVEFCQSRVNNNDFSYKNNYMESHKGSIATLILGNSLMHNSINPHLMGDSVFNLAISARWVYYDKELLERYIAEMPNLDNVIFGMGYAVPFWRSYHFPEEEAGVSDSVVTYQKYMYEKFMNVRYDRAPYLYWFGFARGLIDKETLFGTFTPVDSIGYDPVFGQLDDWKNNQNIYPEIIHNPHAKEQVAEYTCFLKDMARLCYLNNVRFIVITPPCHDSYIVNVSQEGLDILHGIIDEVRSEFPIEYKDYLQDEAFRADSIYFNCSHLNSVGADMFALRVKDDFKL